MSSRIEQIIEEIEEYIEGCKYQPLSSTKIVVNKDEMEELLHELRAKTPGEIKRYQKIISQEQAIIADANERAAQIIAAAELQNTEMVSEHQIMQQAYAQANEVVMVATKQAQEILDNATLEANSIKMNAMAYTDDMLAKFEGVLVNTIDTSKARYDNLLGSLDGILEIVKANRAEMNPVETPQQPEPEAAQVEEEPAEKEASEPEKAPELI